MPGHTFPGTLGTTTSTTPIDQGTLALTTSPPPGTVGAGTAATTSAPAATESTSDPDIEALNLEPKARAGAYALKKQFPSVQFTSGRRDTAEQAHAMAGNVVKERSWIGKTYKTSALRDACQKWVDDHPEKVTRDEIGEGILSVFNDAPVADVQKFSKHFTGEAFDVQPVEIDAEAIKKAIRELDGCTNFLEKEGGLVRWHAEF